jgi:hypothetical protein
MDCWIAVLLYCCMVVWLYGCMAVCLIGLLPEVVLHQVLFNYNFMTGK